MTEPTHTVRFIYHDGERPPRTMKVVPNDHNNTIHLEDTIEGKHLWRILEWDDGVGRYEDAEGYIMKY